MPNNFALSMENAAVAFATYALSLIAAFSWNQAVQDALKDDKPWKKWAFAAVITVCALIIITIIVMFHDDDDDPNTVTSLKPQRLRQSKKKPRMGRFE